MAFDLFAFVSVVDWPQFRGLTGSGLSNVRCPVTWSETNHVKWKTAIPERRRSSSGAKSG